MIVLTTDAMWARPMRLAARYSSRAPRAGLARATGDVILFQDADLEYEVEDYDDLVRPICA